MDTDQIEEELERELDHPENYIGRPLLSTGATLLNLALSGNINGGIPAGSYLFYVGGSSSGKTVVTLSTFAEAQRDERFAKYNLFYDNAEDGAMMDIAKFYGSKVAEKIQAPKIKDGKDIFSETVEDFYFNLDNKFKHAKQYKKPFIYLLDSMDSLGSLDMETHFEETKKAVEAGKKPPGSYKMDKPRTNSDWLRRAISDLRDTGSILIIICQTRDNVGGGQYESSERRGGGHAIKFYAAAEVWTRHKKLKEERLGLERQLGISVTASVKKNRISGKEWDVKFPIYWSYGIYDIESCVDFLVEEGLLKLTGDKEHTDLKAFVTLANKTFNLTDWYDEKFEAIIDKLDEEYEVFVEAIKNEERKGNPLSKVPKRKFIELLEERGLEELVRRLVQVRWDAIEEACQISKKKKYD